MTIHEEQPVTAEPRIDDENTADAVREPENVADAVEAETVREPDPAPDAVEAEPPRDHESSTAEMLFAGDDVADLRARWAGVQAAFVDNPKECVQKADHLVSDLVEQLTTGFAQARSRLEEQWSRGQEASTEDLRMALMHYREFFDRLLAV
jgi:phosphoglycolate phosphatase-like HAD superfamily hydrolase